MGRAYNCRYGIKYECMHNIICVGFTNNVGTYAKPHRHIVHKLRIRSNSCLRVTAVLIVLFIIRLYLYMYLFHMDVL